MAENKVVKLHEIFDVLPPLASTPEEAAQEEAARAERYAAWLRSCAEDGTDPEADICPF